MKKRPFVLIELFIAITILAFAFLPLVQGHSFYVKKERKELLRIEQERKAEELFYQVCKNLTKKHPLEKIPALNKVEASSLGSNKVIFNLGKLHKHTYYWHYHLYAKIKQENRYQKLYCKICFLTHPKLDCTLRKNNTDAEYKFVLAIQKQSKT